MKDKTLHGSDLKGPTAELMHAERLKTTSPDAERRAILARLGKMAALTGPAVVTLMLSTRASAASPL
jgi:hypothetical protein